MNLEKIEKIKGFMPTNEGKALLKWAEKFSNFGPILEIGTYCGKSSLYLAPVSYTHLTLPTKRIV